MILKIDIAKFGLFSDYSWDASIGNNHQLRKLNILYGRNYAGKTTISRIFRCMESGTLHAKYANGNFSIKLKDGDTITCANLAAAGAKYKIRVYNRDFVRDNLSWLHNDDGTIQPFTVLGAKNVEISNKIDVIDAELGSIEQQKGLLFELQTAANACDAKKAEYINKVNEVDGKLRTKAQGIKNNTGIYDYPTYQITHIKNDISNITSASVLADEKTEELKSLLKEDSLGQLVPLSESRPNFAKYLSETKALLEQHIKPTQAIADLVSNALLQDWVRIGIERNKGRETCGFCGGTLSAELWSKLDAHFNKESEELRKKVLDQIEILNGAKEAINSYLDIDKSSFYPSLHPKVEGILKKWKIVSKSYSDNIAALVKKLKLREKDIFNQYEVEAVEDESENVLDVIKEMNKLINEHNGKDQSLEKDQLVARGVLRMSEVASFAASIDYAGCVEKIAEAKKASDQLTLEKKAKQALVDGKIEEKRVLEAQAKDESKGAELVNQHLTHFFGHDELKLVAEGEAPNIKFKVVRDGSEANNLSEGESSLISFCYFIARMEDEIKVATSKDDLIIYIDDPISSLDSNHIFFMFSLIESVICKPNNYAQLFISTHNLDFLKYLQNLTIPKYKPQPDSKPKSDLIYLLVERKNKSKSQLKLAPDYLKKYITEFNYLFNEIHVCSLLDEEAIGHSHQYSFGNNMRKFLEAYLFYKYPSHHLSFSQRMDKFFAGDPVTMNLVNRIVNEYSHLESRFERGLEPVDVAAISRVSKAVTLKLQSTDPEQYAALLESIGAS